LGTSDASSILGHFLTTLIGVGQGLFLALYTGQLYSVIEVLPVQESATFYAPGSLIALVFLVAGLFASLFHLGHPERAWRSAGRSVLPSRPC
jgi:DMSO reductase anchor subunit